MTDHRPSPASVVTFRPAVAGDAEDLLKLQYLCYQPEAALYGHDIQPLTQRLHEVVAEIDSGPAFVADQGGLIVGGVRCRFEGDVMHLGKLICHPRMQRQGIATQLVALAEQCARQQAGVTAVVLFTGARSVGNLRFYQQCGYHTTHAMPPDFVWLRKELGYARMTTFLVSLDKKCDY